MRSGHVLINKLNVVRAFEQDDFDSDARILIPACFIENRQSVELNDKWSVWRASGRFRGNRTYGRNQCEVIVKRGDQCWRNRSRHSSEVHRRRPGQGTILIAVWIIERFEADPAI